jgi:hypothetical protein
MSTPEAESEAVAARLAQAAERLKADQTAAPTAPPQSPRSLTAAEALVLLREACEGLAATDLEVRRARSEIAGLAAAAAAWQAPRDAA